MNLTQTHNEIMEQHEIRLQELQKLISRGDWISVAEKTGIKSNTAQIAFGRKKSKNHLKVVKALEEVIAERVAQFKIA